MTDIEDFKTIVTGRKYFKILIGILICVFCSIYLVSIFVGGFYHANSDDFSQYRSFMEGTFNQIKGGQLSFLDLRSLYGQSIFAMEYYIPIDIFTLLTFIISFIIPFNYTYSLVELSKIVVGVLVFYKLLQKLGFKDKTSFIVSLIYLVSGASTIFYNYSTYVTITAYFPIFMFLLFYNKDKNIKWSLTLTTFLLMLYNFYLGYMIVAVSLVIMMIVDYIRSNKDFKGFIKEELILVLKYSLWIVIGVLCSGIIIVPSIYYILSQSSTKRGLVWWYSIKHFIILFVNFFSPTSITYFKTIANNYDYIAQQASLFMTLFGLMAISNLIYISHDKERKKYIITLIIEFVMIIVPLFSWFFCASLGGYSRWLFGLAFINLFLIATSFEREEFDLSILKNKNFFIPFFSLTTCVLIIDIVCKLVYDNFEGYVAFIPVFLYLLTCLKFKDINPLKLRKLAFACEIFIAVFVTFNVAFSADIGIIKDKKIITNAASTVEVKNLEKVYISDSINETYVYNSNIGFYSKNLTSESQYFHSFYNKVVNDYIYNYNGEYVGETWYKAANRESSPMNLAFLNYKYLVLSKDESQSYIVDYLTLVDDSHDKYNVYLNNLYSDGSIYYSQHKSVYDDQIENKLSLVDSVWVDDDFLPMKEMTNDVRNYSLLNDFEYKRETVDKKFNLKFDFSNFDSEGKYFEVYEQDFSKYFNLVEIEYEDGSVEYGFNNSFVGKKKIKTVTLHCGFKEKFGDFKLSVIDYSVIKNKMSENVIDDVKVDIKGSTFKVNLTKASDKAIVVLPVTYSDEFVCEEGYEVIKANGSFIGVVLDTNDENINLTIKYRPKGLKQGLILSVLGVVATGGLIGASYVYHKKKEDNENEL